MSSDDKKILKQGSPYLKTFWSQWWGQKLVSNDGVAFHLKCLAIPNYTMEIGIPFLWKKHHRLTRFYQHILLIHWIIQLCDTATFSDKSGVFRNPFTIRCRDASPSQKSPGYTQNTWCTTWRAQKGWETSIIFFQANLSSKYMHSYSPIMLEFYRRSSLM